MEVQWRPCEVHGRPEPAARYSDLAIQGMFYAQDHEADLWEYHDRMYRAALVDRADIGDVGVLSSYVTGLLDPEDFRKALRDGDYRDRQREANRYAFAQCGVEVVPSYRLGGVALNAIEDVGVPFDKLASLLKKLAK